MLVAILPATMHAHPLQSANPKTLSAPLNLPTSGPAPADTSLGDSVQESLPQPIDTGLVPSHFAADYPSQSSMGDAFIPRVEDVYESNAAFDDIIQIDSYYSRRMLDILNRQTDKQLLVLSNVFESGSPSLVVGGQFRASFLAASTNKANKFPYQGRFPRDFTGTTATDARMLQANIGATAHVGTFAHGYGEVLFSDVFTFPTFNQGSFQVRQAYLVLGNQYQSPFYGFIGKKNVSFGDMRTLNPFSQSMVWHYFNAVGEGIGGGYQSGNFHWNITGINGGRSIRVADSPSKGRINNFASNATFCLCDGPNRKFEFGAGYLHGTIYDALEPEHIDPEAFGNRNPAWDINSRIRFNNWQLSGEFVSTVNPWPATEHRVNAWRLESAANVWAWGMPATASVGWSEGNQGPVGSEFEFNRQLVLGFGLYPNINTQISMEYVLSSGFAPLMNIKQVSDREVQQHSLVFGLVLVL